MIVPGSQGNTFFPEIRTLLHTDSHQLCPLISVPDITLHQQVSGGSPAALAGLQVGDKLLALGNLDADAIRMKVCHQTNDCESQYD